MRWVIMIKTCPQTFGGKHALLRISGKMSGCFLGRSPVVKETEDFASNGSGGNGQSSGKIMKEQPTVPPVGEQVPGSP